MRSLLTYWFLGRRHQLVHTKKKTLIVLASDCEFKVWVHDTFVQWLRMASPGQSVVTDHEGTRMKEWATFWLVISDHVISSFTA